MTDRSRITRRDFLDGILLALGSTLLPPMALGDGFDRWLTDDDYPPGRTGLRGNHPGALETAHALAWTGKRDWGTVTEPDGSDYDLAVVGAGISGLAAAWFFRQQNPKAKILLLDNHDDFGGHAKRNEFLVDGRTRLSYGGSQTIQTPGRYSRIAASLLRDLGVKFDRFVSAYDMTFFRRHALRPVTFFDGKTYGKASLVPYTLTDLSWGVPGIVRSALSPEQAVERMPLGSRAKEQLLRIMTGGDNALDRIAAAARLGYAGSTPYFTFLREQHHADDPDVFRLLRSLPAEYTGQGADTLSTLEALALELPGITPRAVSNLAPEPSSRLTLDETEPYIHHFPDGNASIARLLVRQLMPHVAPGSTMDDVVLAPFDYGRLDRSDSPVRLRLNSTVVRVTHDGPPHRADRVSVTYVHKNRAYRVRATHCVLACYNMMIPHLVPELPQEQKDALRQAAKAPLVYTTVSLRNWRAIREVGLGAAECPGSFHQSVLLDYPVRMGGYGLSDDPAHPMIVTMIHVPLADDYGTPPREQFRQGRFKLFSMPFAQFETAVKDHLNDMLGQGGFDADRDIQAITVNRWAHGYAYQGSALYDPEVAPERSHHVLGRRPMGHITIANSDAGARAYVDTAIDQAWRAVQELPVSS
ncbi:Twin-arginine translocation pathway signal [Nitrospira japonica]|uniref:Twin-arginine translocation pathway signal n=1 Tax=Nitrospira japonica TaxID=1325564 RepID=A0A1W1I0J6_9BACT|nr:FAD-dependent oxidoreductase [Nitrospira japonica]SLM46502.1 Twin-arginine translocation pathway signal [Nitrospira japonica]